MTFENLPDELIIYVLSFVDPSDIIRIQLVSRRFFALGRDHGLWKVFCYIYSRADAERRVREALENQESRIVALRRAIEETNSASLSSSSSSQPPPLSSSQGVSHPSSAQQLKRHNRRKRALANWEPSYQSENVNYYEEYIHRYAPTSTQYLQLPDSTDSEQEQECLGVGILKDAVDGAPKLALAPLERGSICVWDISPDSSSRGKIVASSQPGLLQGDVDNGKVPSKIRLSVEVGAVDNVSVDSYRETAFIANQSQLTQIDLNTLKVIRHQSFPFPITALSEARGNTPLTIGTNMTLHLYDVRADRPQLELDLTTRCELIAGTPLRQDNSTLVDISNAHASLSQPRPLSILHIPSSPTLSEPSSSIWIAGRFTSLLHYDRRFWPRIEETVFSGARISSISCVPYPFVHPDLRKPDADPADLRIAKSGKGMTLCAAGEYKGKGSLELYSISPLSADLLADGDTSMATSTSNSHRRTRSFTGIQSYRNRQSASSSGLLSVAAHGARFVISDGNGLLKWFERDARTLVRKFDINRSWANNHKFGSHRFQGTQNHEELCHGDDDLASAIVQKILPLQSSTSPSHTSRSSFNTNDLLVWTSDGLVGLVGFGKDQSFQQTNRSSSLASSRTSLDGNRYDKDEEKEREREREYAGRMRQALERQADETRWMRGLGLAE